VARRTWSASSEADPFGADEFAGARRRGRLGDPGDDRFAADGADGAAPAAPEVDPVERARGLAWRSLNKRDRTVDEVGGMLLAKRVEPAVADQVVTELIELGYLDDARYAQRFAEDRRRLDAWGSDRIARRLRELGVDREAIEAAVAAQEPEEELSAAQELLRRRCPAPPTTRAERDRALGILIRRGYAPELALDALRRHAGVEAEPDC
jgi:regulatory protein